MAVVANQPLLGREAEQRVLEGLLDDVHVRGGGVAITGEAGIGKTALMDSAKAAAASRGFRVLETVGLESESSLPYAGLHLLLLSLLDDVQRLPPRQRDALLTAFGVSDEAAPDRFLLALAVLNLLSEAAGEAPLLVVIDDGHWVDRASAEALAFVARRLEAEPIIVVVGVREGHASAFDADLPSIELRPLGLEHARAILGRHTPPLGAELRERLLREAGGNPLALAELPMAATDAGSVGALDAWLPLTTRLEKAFAVRLASLAPETRTALLIAAVNDGESTREVLDATAALLGALVTEEILEPALARRLVVSDGTSLHFRHPLIRSSIQQAGAPAQRRAAHAALAGVLGAEPDRRTWHRAAATVERDEDVAAALEAAALRAQHRGADEAAVALLERAGQLSVAPDEQGRRTMAAAMLAHGLGRAGTVMRLLNRNDELELAPQQRARVDYIRSMYGIASADGDATPTALADAAQRAGRSGDLPAVRDLLSAASARAWYYGSPWAGCRERVVAVAEQQLESSDPALLLILGRGAPVECGALVIRGVARGRRDASRDPDKMQQLATAASVTGDHESSLELYAAAIDGLRSQGRLGVLAETLAAQALTAGAFGDARLAGAAAEEARRLSLDTGYEHVLAASVWGAALAAGLRGDDDGVERLVAGPAGVALQTGAGAVVSYCSLARAMAAAANGRNDDAFGHLRRVYDEGHPAVTLFTLGDLVDAAVHSGRADEARPVMDGMEAIGRITPSPALHTGLRFARPLLAADADAEPLFLEALASPGWPLLRGRAHLTYGAWLRRQRRATDSRPVLRAARDMFDALDAPTWSARARSELRASGETTRRRTPSTRDNLTPQELQIALMAAEGLTNREIGERLYLSPRTISTHLYHLFPKLGVTGRAELRDALPTAPTGPAAVPPERGEDVRPPRGS